MDTLYDLGIKDFEKVDGFHNEIFKGNYKNNNLIVRISKSNRRNEDSVRAEIEFIQLLQGKVNVIEPYYISGECVFLDEDKVITLFKYVEGHKWNELEHTDEIIYNAGRQLAKIHKLSSETRKSFERPDYKQHNDIKLYLKNYREDIFVKEYEYVIRELESKSKEKDYFLIHGDYLFSNIIYNNSLTVIDFDDCEYGYYQYDIAVYMFYYLLGGNPLDIDVEGNRERLNTFLKGYNSIRDIGFLTLEDLNLFFRLRQLKLMGTISEYQGDTMGEWQKRFIKSSVNRIKNSKNFI